MNKKECVFCSINNELILRQSEYSLLIANRFPIGKYSLLVIPKRHIDCITELKNEELLDMMNLVQLAVKKIEMMIGVTIEGMFGDEKKKGANIFFNKGVSSGQTEEHFHIHIVGKTRRNNGVKIIRCVNQKKRKISKKGLDHIKTFFCC